MTWIILAVLVGLIAAVSLAFVRVWNKDYYAIPQKPPLKYVGQSSGSPVDVVHYSCAKSRPVSPAGRASGLCSACKARPATPGMRFCIRCAEFMDVFYENLN